MSDYQQQGDTITDDLEYRQVGANTIIHIKTQRVWHGVAAVLAVGVIALLVTSLVTAINTPTTTTPTHTNHWTHTP